MYVNRVLRPVAEKGVLEPIQAINRGQNGLLLAPAVQTDPEGGVIFPVCER